MIYKQAVQSPAPCVAGGGVSKCGEQLGGRGQLFKVQGMGIEQNVIQYVGQQEFSNDPIEGCIIGPDVHGLLDGPCDVVCLPTHY